MENDISWNSQNQVQIQNQFPQEKNYQKKSIKKIIVIVLTLAFTIFAIIPFLVTAVVVLLYSFSH